MIGLWLILKQCLNRHTQIPIELWSIPLWLISSYPNTKWIGIGETDLRTLAMKKHRRSIDSSCSDSVILLQYDREICCLWFPSIESRDYRKLLSKNNSTPFNKTWVYLIKNGNFFDLRENKEIECKWFYFQGAHGPKDNWLFT